MGRASNRSRLDRQFANNVDRHAPVASSDRATELPAAPVVTETAKTHVVRFVAIADHAPQVGSADQLLFSPNSFSALRKEIFSRTSCGMSIDSSTLMVSRI